MPTDCVALSQNAQKIFGELKQYFPKNAYDRDVWIETGIIDDNGLFDLRRAQGRADLERKIKERIGDMVLTRVQRYIKEKPDHGFDIEHFGAMICREAQILEILVRLDFQIETLDIVENV